MDSLPIFLRVAGESCLVVGGGPAAANRADLLLRAGAAPSVVTPDPGSALRSLAARRRIELLPREFRAADVAGRRLVFAATGDEAADRGVAAAADARGVPVHVADRPALCAFTMPAIVERSPVVVAVSTGGASPMLARHLRARLEVLLPSTLGDLARFAAALRDAAHGRLVHARERRAFWSWVMDGPVAGLVHDGEPERARAAAEAALADPSRWRGTGGEVCFLDAGGRAPDHCTLSALRAAQGADVVVHDADAPPGWLDLARRDAPRIRVEAPEAGRRAAGLPVEELLVAQAREGRKVLRLRSGAAADEARSRAERQAVAARGVPVRVFR